MKDVSAEELLDMLTTMHIFKASKILDIPVDALYKKLEDYEIQTGKKIGNLSNLRKKNRGVPAERLLKIYTTGSTVEEIARGRRMKPSTVRRILRQYFESHGEEVPEDLLEENDLVEKPKAAKPKVEPKKREPDTKETVTFDEFKKTVIYLYYNKKLNAQEIVEHFMKKGKEVEDYEILNIISEQQRVMSELRTKKTVETSATPETSSSETESTMDWQLPKIPERVPEKPKIDVDEEIKYMLLHGMTLRKWSFSKEHIDHVEEVGKRLEQLRVIASHINKTETGYMADDAFLEVLDLLENRNAINPYDRFMVYLNQYVSLHGVCQYGKIDSMKLKIFKSNRDLTTYVLSGMGLDFRGYDKNAWELYREKYLNKINLYFARLQAIDEKRKENKKKTSNDESGTAARPTEEPKEL